MVKTLKRKLAFSFFPWDPRTETPIHLSKIIQNSFDVLKRSGWDTTFLSNPFSSDFVTNMLESQKKENPVAYWKNLSYYSRAKLARDYIRDGYDEVFFFDPYCRIYTPPVGHGCGQYISLFTNSKGWIEKVIIFGKMFALHLSQEDYEVIDFTVTLLDNEISDFGGTPNKEYQQRLMYTLEEDGPGNLHGFFSFDALLNHHGVDKIKKSLALYKYVFDLDDIRLRGCYIDSENTDFNPNKFIMSRDEYASVLRDLRFSPSLKMRANKNSQVCLNRLKSRISQLKSINN